MKLTLPLILSAVLIFSALICGCAPGSTDMVLECTAPLIQKGDGCCMDADRNGICDIEERPAKTGDNMTEDAETPSEEPEMPRQETEEYPEEEEAAEMQKGNLEDAEKTGKLFADNWQRKQYNIMYASFTPSLKQKKTTTEFTAIMELEPLYKRVDKVDFNGVKMSDEDTAELDIMIHTSIQDIKMPGATLEFIGGEWKVNAFVDVFELDAYYAACSGYRYDTHYTMKDCAYDFAKKVNDPGYCNISGCHYTECLKTLGETVTHMQEAEQCKLCQPVGKTINTCVLDVAIKHDKIAACNVISEDRYSDKYCVCYGGFARHKGSSGYCNMIEDEDNKYLCQKAYKGEYC
ncbi:hypothetical protein JW898_05415 [Candidatus Woesearchaeota archaeon]|nr:hypothetical protein [Candidatus Woesearchaeota archaeon]